MIGAQGYQESQLDQSARSHAGAIGIMQLLPSTAADPNVGIPDVTTERNNVHAGVRYLRFLRDRYFSEPHISDFDRSEEHTSEIQSPMRISYAVLCLK